MDTLISHFYPYLFWDLEVVSNLFKWLFLRVSLVQVDAWFLLLEKLRDLVIALWSHSYLSSICLSIRKWCDVPCTLTPRYHPSIGFQAIRKGIVRNKKLRGWLVIGSLFETHQALRYPLSIKEIFKRHMACIRELKTSHRLPVRLRLPGILRALKVKSLISCPASFFNRCLIC